MKYFDGLKALIGAKDAAYERAYNSNEEDLDHRNLWFLYMILDHAVSLWSRAMQDD